MNKKKYTLGAILRDKGRTFIILRVNKKSLSLREVFIRKGKTAGMTMGEFYKMKLK